MDPYKKACIVVGFYFIWSRLLIIAFSVNLGLLCMPHPGMGSLVLASLPGDGEVSCFDRLSGKSPIQSLA